MKRFINNLSTNIKLILSFAIILVLLATVIITAYLGITNVNRSEKSLRDVNFKISSQLELLRANLNYNRAEILEMMLAQNLTDQQTIEALISERSTQDDSILTELKTLNPDPAFQSELLKLVNDLNTYRATRT
jgi:Na+-transporting NADH:ubiquinone oxidoreductase subunit NqrC